MDKGGSAVVVRRLSKVYEPSPGWMRLLVRTNLTHDVVALDSVDFEVDPGEILAVVGPNGAGKSTAFRILVGLTSPTTGTATVMGFDCAKESKRVRRMIGWMPAEDRSLLLRLSCRENLRFHARLHDIPRREIDDKVMAALADVGLSEYADDTPFALSAGMRARLQLARAILHRPKVLILDEPTGSIDPVAAHTLLELIQEIVAANDIAALISSHRLEEIEALHSNVILLDKGSVRYNGDLDELRNEYGRMTVQMEFDGTEAARSVTQTLSRSDENGHVTREDLLVSVDLLPGEQVASLLAKLGPDLNRLTHIRESRTPLRDVLASIYLEQNRT